MEIRPAEPGDVDAVVETITLAFRTDPVWGPALDGPDDLRRSVWRIYVEAALRHRTAFVSEGARTVSVWIPPGEIELSEEQEAAMTALVSGALPAAHAQAMFELWERFEHSHPSQPHAYLSLLATHPDAAGNRYGQAHLAAALARWDSDGAACYLESTNPANNVRYERQGFRAHGEFRGFLDGTVVTTMWRPG